MNVATGNEMAPQKTNRSAIGLVLAAASWRFGQRRASQHREEKKAQPFHHSPLLLSSDIAIALP
jgi:hypothetical protein